MLFRIAFLLIFPILMAHAQRGDKAGEEQPPPSNTLNIPPAPALSPAEALETLHVQPGFNVELVASEPMIEAPVSMCFGADGKLWVLEMRGYMRTVDGQGESQPLGRITVLEDTNGDGKIDKSTVFLDGLLLPRALMVLRDGVLVAEPPRLWFCRDTNGDGKCDEKIEIVSDYGSQQAPEHTANGLMWDLDNWIYSANYTSRFRNVDGKWQKDATAFRGQWGLSQDDYGRLFYDSNSDQLRADLVPSSYLMRNPNLRGPAGMNVQLSRDQSVWPIRVNTGVNRGYQKGQLRADGSLATFTAACAPCVYRGDQFPDEFKGAVFLCEPAGNVVRCDRLTERDGWITATNAFHHAEFLASTDERFRPVNLLNGPDGALYVVDMYRGVIQHRLYVTSYLRREVLSRDLENPVDRGRIYRVVSKTKPIHRSRTLDKATPPRLVEALSNPNGWTRDTAQRLLVERREASVLPALKKLAAGSPNPLAQIHALWILDAFSAADAPTIQQALDAKPAKVRAAAIRISEPILKQKEDFLPVLLQKVKDPETDVRLQLLLTLGEMKKDEAELAMAEILKEGITNALFQDAAVSGLAGRELKFTKLLFKDPHWAAKGPGPASLFTALAKCIALARNSENVDQLLGLAANDTDQPWRQIAVLDGLLGIVPPAPKGKPAAPVHPIQLKEAPHTWGALKTLPDEQVQVRLAKLDPLLVWPGKPGMATPIEVKPLTKDEQARFDAGKDLYVVTCGACHQPHGLGQEGLAPPLADSGWVTGSPERLARIVLQGLRGPISVKGKTYELEMPPLAIFEDEQIAALLTYVRREWGHTASPVDAAFVAKVREATNKREEAWKEADLLKIP